MLVLYSCNLAVSDEPVAFKIVNQTSGQQAPHKAFALSFAFGDPSEEGFRHRVASSAQRVSWVDQQDDDQELHDFSREDAPVKHSKGTCKNEQDSSQDMHWKTMYVSVLHSGSI